MTQMKWFLFYSIFASHNCMHWSMSEVFSRLNTVWLNKPLWQESKAKFFCRVLVIVILFIYIFPKPTPCFCITCPSPLNSDLACLQVVTTSIPCYMSSEWPAGKPPPQKILLLWSEDITWPWFTITLTCPRHSWAWCGAWPKRGKSFSLIPPLWGLG